MSHNTTFEKIRDKTKDINSNVIYDKIKLYVTRYIG